MLNTLARLAATLGPQSSFKKRFNRKAIFEVDVPKACETILTPEAPMALRLQSNLLSAILTAPHCELSMTKRSIVLAFLESIPSNVNTFSQMLKRRIIK